MRAGTGLLIFGGRLSVMSAWLIAVFGTGLVAGSATSRRAEAALDRNGGMTPAYRRGNTVHRGPVMFFIVTWLLGVPIGLIVLLWLLGIFS